MHLICDAVLKGLTKSFLGCFHLQQSSYERETGLCIPLLLISISAVAQAKN